MNSTTPALNYASFLANVTAQFNRYVPIPLFLLGMIGNTLNVYILNRPSLRANSCSVCFTAASLIHILVLFDGLIPRILLSFDKDPADTSDFLCKLKYYLIYSSSALSSWLIVLATIDRYLSSSPHAQRRQWNSVRRTRWMIAGIAAFAAVFFIDKPICFMANIQNEVLKCNAQRGSCRSYHDYSYIVVYSLTPCILMGIFGSLTIMNVRRPRRAIAAQAQVQGTVELRHLPRHMISRDRQLISMLLVQITFLVLFSFPISIVRIYLGLTSSISKTPLRSTQEVFVLQFVIMLTYIPIIDTFYIYTIFGKIFRKELRLIISLGMNKIGINLSRASGEHSATMPQIIPLKEARLRSSRQKQSTA